MTTQERIEDLANECDVCVIVCHSTATVSTYREVPGSDGRETTEETLYTGGHEQVEAYLLGFQTAMALHLA